MGIAKLYGQKTSGIDINGIIKNYYVYAGSNVSAGDLVEYINGVAGQTTETSTDTQLSTDSYSGYKISAVKLDDNRIFIAHSRGGDYSLYGIVVTINGATITAGTDTKIDSSYKYTGYVISTQLLSDGNVFIANSRGGSYYLDCNLVSINGTTITYLKGKQLSTTSNTGSAISTQLLPNGKVFIAHSRDGIYYLYGMIVTINGTSITHGTDTQLSTTTYAGAGISTQLLSNGNIFIAHSYDENYKLYGMVVTINGTSITAGTDTQLSNTTGKIMRISAQLLLNGNIFIAWGRVSDYAIFYGTVATINGTSITAGTDTSISGTVDIAITADNSTQLLPNGNVLVVFGAGSGYLCGIIAMISGTVITWNTVTRLNTDVIAYSGYLTVSTQLLSNGNIFVAHLHTGGEYYLYSQIFGIDEENNVPTNQIKVPTYETQVRKTTTSKFDGIAKTSGVGGTSTAHNQQVSIYTLN